MISAREHRGVPSPDSALDEVAAWFRAQGDLTERFGRAVRRAIDEVIDTPRTGRYSIDQLDPQEKTYIGFKVENVIRAEFSLPAARAHQKDYVVAGHEVDCKWSIHYGGWAIPEEQVGHLCLLVFADDEASELAVGLVRTTEDVLNQGRNRDRKRTLRAEARDHVANWLIPRQEVLPENFLLHLEPEDRDAILGANGGVERAYELYRRCAGRVITREVMAAVGQQQDDARRFRGGAGGVRERLENEGYVVLNGQWVRDRERSLELGGPRIGPGESVCLKVS